MCVYISLWDGEFRFINAESNDYVFLKNYHKKIPADGFDRYCKDIWVKPFLIAIAWYLGLGYIFQSKILVNKDLDLPTQKELLAQFRCDEIAMVSFWVGS